MPVGKCEVGIDSVCEGKVYMVWCAGIKRDRIDDCKHAVKCESDCNGNKCRSHNAANDSPR